MNTSSIHIPQSLQLAWWKAAALAAEQAVAHRRALVGLARLSGLAALAAAAYMAGTLVGQWLDALRF
jgi:hypothetical protein